MKLNRITLLLAFFFVLQTATAQEDDEKTSGFKKENLFTGGTLNVSFGNNLTSLGISPFFGYSVNKYLDVAASFGVNYLSQRDYSGYNSNDKLRQTNYSPGAFIRVFPVKFLFAQAQYEFNIIKYKYIPAPNSGGIKQTGSVDAHSFLVGGGFASGRSQYNKSYYYISILWDVANASNSPYKDQLNRAVPVIRAGYNIALFQGRKR